MHACVLCAYAHVLVVVLACAGARGGERLMGCLP